MTTSRETTQHPNIHFFGIRRSGNHAVLNWIIENAQHNGLKVAHYNDIHDTRMKPPKIPRQGDADLTADADVDLVIYSYQDVALSELDTVPFFTEDKGAKRMTVTRDLRNLIASRIAMYADLEARGFNRSVQTFSFADVAAMWSEYATEYLEHPGPTSGNIHFPLWFKSKEYRDELFKTLGLGENHDLGLDTVPDFGFGSSFTKLEFDGRAREMPVLERWKKFEADPRFQEALAPHADLCKRFDAVTG